MEISASDAKVLNDLSELGQVNDPAALSQLLEDFKEVNFLVQGLHCALIVFSGPDEFQHLRICSVVASAFLPSRCLNILHCLLDLAHI